MSVRPAALFNVYEKVLNISRIDGGDKMQIYRLYVFK